MLYLSLNRDVKMRISRKLAIVTGVVLLFGVTTSLIAYEIESHHVGSASQYPYPIESGFKPLPLSLCTHANKGKDIGVMISFGYDGHGPKHFIECGGRIVVQDFKEVRIPGSNADLFINKTPSAVDGHWGVVNHTIDCVGPIADCFIEYR